MNKVLLVVAAFLCQGQVTDVQAQTDVDGQISAEQNQNLQFLTAGVDRVGGRSSIAQHGRVTGSSPRARQLAVEHRRRFLQDVERVRINMILCPMCVQPNNCNTSTVTCSAASRFRSADGSCNNLANPEWGKSVIPFRRNLPPEYGDRTSSPRTRGSNGQPLPSARVISTGLHQSDENKGSLSDVTHMVMQFAQFLDHDLTIATEERGDSGADIVCCTEDFPPSVLSILNVANRYQCFPIPIPAGDRRFTTRRCMNFVRSAQGDNSNCNSVPGEQMNELTAYIDASQVYGSHQEDQDLLREHTGGLLDTSRESPRELLPHSPGCESEAPNVCYVAGDERVDEHMALTSEHTIWLREHNRIARVLAGINQNWNDERLFQETRKIVGAMMQHITYKHFLPIILGQDNVVKYQLDTVNSGYNDVYDSEVDASIRNSFAAAAYRFGHSMVKSLFTRPNKKYVGQNTVQLRESFLNTSIIENTNGGAVNTLIRGLVRDRAQAVDRFISKELTDFLFPDDDGDSMDLMALNIQRGRDHGIPGYNAWRRWCGLPEASNFNSLVDHPAGAVTALRALYSSPDDIDLFSAGVSENPQGSGLVGPTFACIIGRQFRDIKLGDRFWYETSNPTVGFTPDQLAEIRKSSLARIICDNTDTTNIQRNAFRRARTGNRRVSCSKLPAVYLTKWAE